MLTWAETLSANLIKQKNDDKLDEIKLKIAQMEAIRQ